MLLHVQVKCLSIMQIYANWFPYVNSFLLGMYRISAWPDVWLGYSAGLAVLHHPVLVPVPDNSMK